MTRVMHILPRLGNGGAEWMATNLMRTLDGAEFEAAAISLYDPLGTKLDGILDQAAIPVWYLGKRRGFDPRMFVRVGRAMRDFRPEVVHTHSYVLRYALPHLSRWRYLAMVHTVHTLAEKEVGRSGRLVHRVAFRRGVVPVVIAHEAAESFQRVYGRRGSPLIPNGIPVDEFRQPLVNRERWREVEGFSTADVIFVCVAQLRPEKNPALLLEAFARGPAYDPRARLLFVGVGSLSEDLKRRIKALGMEEKVRLLGRRSDVADILNAADAFVLASAYEGNPLSVMEAMATGKPVVCTAVGGVPELVEDGECGLLVPPGEAEALAGAMNRLLKSPALRASLGASAAARAVERFDVRAMTTAYEDLYRRTIAKATRKSRKRWPEV